MTRLFSFGVLVAIVILVGAMFYQVMASFFVPIFMAMVLVVIFRPLHEWMLVKCQRKAHLAAGLTTALILLIAVVPVAWISVLAVVEGAKAISQWDTQRIQAKLHELRTKLDLESPFDGELRDIDSQLAALEDAQASGRIPSDHATAVEQAMAALARTEAEITKGIDHPEETTYAQLRASLAEIGKLRPDGLHYVQQLRQVRVDFLEFKQDVLGGPLPAVLKTWANPSEQELRAIRTGLFEQAKPWLSSVAGKGTALLARMLLGTIVMAVSLFFFLVDGPKLLKSFLQLSPLEETYERELLAEFESVSRAVVLSMLLSALAQGLTAFFGFYFVGVGSVNLLTFLTTAIALVPFVGAAAVWVPVSLYLFFVEGRVGAAAGLAIYGFFVISMVDNIIKPWVLHGQTKLHPLFALLSVLGGVQALGPIGLLVGPMIVAFLQALLKILHRELHTLDRHSGNATSRDASSPSDPAPPALPDPPSDPAPAQA